MELLITVLGNALVQYQFRDKLFAEDPVVAAEEWGFRLTKGEREMLELIFKKGNEKYTKELRERFESLEDQIYVNLKTVYMCEKPCKMSVPPPVYPPKPKGKAA